MEILFIRHGITQGNIEKRYTGRTNESLLPQAEELLKLAYYPPVEKIFSSPLLRCTETAELIYPAIPIEECQSLIETDFGIYENKNFLELQHLPAYYAWIDGKIPPPSGESREDFQNRCVEGFHQIIKQSVQANLKRIAIVTHGGVIMAILHALAKPTRTFYDWQVTNGDGWKVTISPLEWQKKKHFSLILPLHPKEGKKNA